jgi:hypothetical protein
VQKINTLKYRTKINLEADIYYGGVNLVFEDKETTLYAPLILTATYFLSNNIRG